jgi:hypothetical protein
VPGDGWVANPLKAREPTVDGARMSLRPCAGPRPADCNKPTVDDGDYYVPPTGAVRVNVTVTVIDATNAARWST